MKITELEFVNLLNDNTFSLRFNNGLTLLVGMSGVGKTRILNSICFMKKIALGEIDETDSFTWKLVFEKGDSTFTWQGEVKDGLFNRESLLKDNEYIFRRLPDSLELQGSNIPSVSQKLSILSVFWGVLVIKEIYNEIMNIYMISVSNVPEDSYVKPNILDDVNIYNSVTLSCSNYNVYEKMAIAWSRGYEVFEEIKEEFITVFPIVDDIKFDYYKNGRDYTLFFKEKNTDWISQESLSAGMKKSLYHIASLHLLPNGSVLLIDEVENSMGVKCLDLVSDMISHNERDFQIILTSHHPYVINNVDMGNWQVALREHNRVYTKNKEELHLGRSHHEAFKQLMNLDEYMEGVIQ